MTVFPGSKRLLSYFLMLSFSFFICISSAHTQETASSANEQPETEVYDVILLPFIAQDAPGYTAMLMDKLTMQNLDRLDLFRTTLLEGEEASVTESVPEDIDPAQLVKRLSRIGKEKGSKYVTAGVISKSGSQYSIKMIIVDAEEERQVLTSEKLAVGLEDVDRLIREISDEWVAAEFPVEVQEQVQKMRKADASENARIRDDLAALEQIAEEDPEEAIQKLPETVQKAVTEKAKKEVVKEEIQQLYETEKEEKRIARNRKWQKYGMLTGYGFRFLSDFFLDISVQSNIKALRSWSLYLNDQFWSDPYEEYDHFHSLSNGLIISSYIEGGLASGGLAYSYLYLRDDVLEIRKGSRFLLALSNSLYLSGRAVSQVSGGLGYYSMDLYDRYIGEHSSPDAILDRYNEYRDAHFIYEISRYVSLPLQYLGAAGIAAAYFWPGEKELLVPSARAAKLMGWANICAGTGAVFGQIALNLYAQGIEAAMKARSPSGNLDADPSIMYNTFAATAGMGALAMYTASAILSTKAIRAPHSSDTAHRAGEGASFQVAVAPAPKGVTLAFEVRR